MLLHQPFNKDTKNEEGRFTDEAHFIIVVAVLGRSIVVHDKNAGGPRLGCANIETSSTKFVHKKLTFKKTTNK